MKNEVLLKLREAIDKREFIDYIFGRGNYQIVNAFVEIPTDIDSIFLNGFNKYVESAKDRDALSEMLSASLVKLTESHVGLWWCIYFVYSYYLGFQPDALKFVFDIDTVIDNINNRIEGHREELVNSKEFVGYRFKDGLWSNITNMVGELNDKLPGRKISI